MSSLFNSLILFLIRGCELCTAGISFCLISKINYHLGEFKFLFYVGDSTVTSGFGNYHLVPHY